MLTAKQKFQHYLDCYFNHQDNVTVIYSDTANDNRGTGEIIHDIGTNREECTYSFEYDEKEFRLYYHDDSFFNQYIIWDIIYKYFNKQQ